MMRSRGPGRALVLAGALVAGLLSCQAGESLTTPGLSAPDSVRATALGQTSIRLDWRPAATQVLERYEIQRRQDARGRFTKLTDIDPNLTTFFDTGLQPETIYGYRIIAVNRVGESSAPSTVTGVQTAPRPGIVVNTGLTGGTPAAIADPNGYRLQLAGPVDTMLTVGTIGTVLIAPLPPGSYTLTLSDVSGTCSVPQGTSRTVVVVDTGVATRSAASFLATCIDPTRGQVTLVADVTGDSVDADGYQASYVGIVSGDSVPALGQATLDGAGAAATFRDLKPGDYQVTLAGVDPPCTLAGLADRSVQVAALSDDTLHYAITCPDRGGGNPNAPFVFRNRWTPQQAGNGQTVTLDISLDLSAVPGQDVGSVQAMLQYDATRLTYVSAAAPAPALMNNLTVNTGTPGSITWLNFTTGSTAPTGVVAVARFTFTVTGSSGQAVRTRSTIATIGDFLGAATIEDQFRVVEDTLAIGTGGGGGGNQPPVAQAGGPYSGAAGAAIRFSSAGSSDPDGTIAGYAWTFGDGGTSTQANPQHTYSGGGSYTATLTVTDNGGATATDQATVVVTGGAGGGAQPFTLRNVFTPQSGTNGQTVTLDISLDASAQPTQDVGAVQAVTRYDSAVLQYVGATAPAPAQMNNLTVNPATPGQISWLNFTTAATPPTGLVGAARFTFTVVGSGTSTTGTTIQAIADAAGAVTLDTLFRVVEDTFAAGGGGGGGNQPPVAQAGGPYSGTAGAAISFSSAGSSDPDGAIASYAWSFGDGTTSSQANPQKSYAAAGSFTATLTVTDNQGATATDQASVTVTQAATPITWASNFGPYNSGLAAYPLAVTLNLSQDLPQTPGVEALQSYVVDSLVWDPALLEYHSLVFASGGGSSNNTNATGGCKCKLSFSGSGLAPNTGLVAVATINFKVKGGTGAVAKPRFYLSSVLSTPANGSFNYLSVLQLVEGSLTLP